MTSFVSYYPNPNPNVKNDTKYGLRIPNPNI